MMKIDIIIKVYILYPYVIYEIGNLATIKLINELY